MIEHGLTGGIRVSLLYRGQHGGVPRGGDFDTARASVFCRTPHQSHEGAQEQRKNGIARGFGQQVVKAEVGIDLLAGAFGRQTTGGRIPPIRGGGRAWPARPPTRQWPLPADGELRSSPRANDPRAANRCGTSPRRPANRPAAPAEPGLAKRRPAPGRPKSAWPRGRRCGRRPAIGPVDPRGGKDRSASNAAGDDLLRNRSATS